MRILVSGGTCGSMDSAEFLVDTASRVGCDTILVLGSWGFLWQSKDSMRELEALLRSVNMEMWWIDGNSENFYLMNYCGCDPGGKVDAWPTTHIRYMPRGFRFSIDGVSCMAFGGGVSMGAESLVPGKTWWPEEEITVRQVEAAGQRPIDVLFSHDAPDGVVALEEILSRDAHLHNQKDLRRSRWNRVMLGEVVDNVTPKLIYHSHHGIRYTGYRGTTRVEGLAHCVDRSHESFVVFDSEDFDG